MTATRSSRLRPTATALIGALFFLSGAAGLVYEVLWFRLLVLKLGGTGLSVATVTAAFMAGLGAGAWLFGTRVALRMPPLVLYGVLEGVIGLYALAVPSLIALAGQLDAALLGTEAAGGAVRVIRFLLAGAVLLPPTLCMGATLPVLARLIEEAGGRPARYVGLLYGLNTTGAVLGAGATGFVLMPRLGLTSTLHLAAALNIALAVTALAIGRGRARESALAPSPKGTSEPPFEPARPGLAVAAFTTSGLVSFILQVSWTRILALIFGSSVYAFSLILVVFLLGLGAGALAGSWLSDRVRSARAGLAWCFVLAGATALLGEGMYGLLPRFYLRALVVGGGGQALGDAGFMAAALMLPTTLLLGAGFPFAVRLATGNRAAHSSAGVARLYAGNTAGSVAGAYTAALWLIPALGLAGAVSAGSLLMMGLGGALALLREREAKVPTRPTAAVPVAAVAACLVWAFLVPGWDRNLMSMGVALWGPRARAEGHDVWRDLASLATDRILYYRDGVTATVVVKEAPGPRGGRPQRYLSVDGHIEASNTGDMPTQILIGQLPLLASTTPAPHVLVVGYASGVTAGSVLTHPVSSLTVVEIEEAVVGASHFFDDVNGRPLEQPPTRFVVNDARAYLERTDRRFDVIISEPSSVWITGPSKLFTHETFTVIRSRLAPGGVLGQWLSTYDLRPDDILTVVRTLRDVFPHVAVLRLLAGADLLLLASLEPVGFDLQTLEAAWSEPKIRADLERAGLSGPCGVLDRVLAEGAAVDRALAPGPINTDDNAILEYHGARTVGTRGEAEALAVLQSKAMGPAALVRGLGESGAKRPGQLAVACLGERAGSAARSLALRQLEDGPDADAHWVLGELLRSQGDRDGALLRFTTALELDPRHGSSLISRAMTLEEMDRLLEALEAWNRAAQEVPSDNMPLILTHRGIVRLSLGDAAGALADLQSAERAARGASLPVPVDLYAARALEELGRASEARPRLEAYLESLAPSEEGLPYAVAARERLARILSRTPTQVRRAAELTERATRDRLRLFGPILENASRLLDEGDEGAARAYLRGLVVLDPALRSGLEREAGARQAAGAPRGRVLGSIVAALPDR